MYHRQGTITFAADDGTTFELPVNEDGTCGPLPRAGVMLRWNPPDFPTLTKVVTVTRKEGDR